MKQYLELKQILQQSHHETLGSTSNKNNKKLSAWAATQRREYIKWKQGEKAAITQERINLLNSIDFDWNPRESRWKTRIRELKEYQSKNGHCMVPVNYEQNPQLGRWVATQRKYYKLYKEGKCRNITMDRIKELTDIGFVWNRWEDIWTERNK
jgi:hypothetical protein